jgi:hypothetical protein
MIKILQSTAWSAAIARIRSRMRASRIAYRKIARSHLLTGDVWMIDLSVIAWEINRAAAPSLRRS